MNVIEAAQYLRNGHRVRRRYWSYAVSICVDDTGNLVHWTAKGEKVTLGPECEFDLEDVRANDWEVVDGPGTLSVGT